jgi:hypothetical protein
MWKVLVKGGEGPNASGIWEISICRVIEPSVDLHPLGHPRNLHHEVSFGWFSEDKIPFSTVDSWMLRGTTQEQRNQIVDACVLQAQFLCDVWNAALKKDEDDLI